MKEACKESGHCSESSLVGEHGTADCLSQNLSVGFLLMAWDVHGTQHTVSFFCFCLLLAIAHLRLGEKEGTLSSQERDCILAL